MMDVRAVLHKVLEAEGVQVEEVREVPAGTRPGDHFMSQVLTMEVRGRGATGQSFHSAVFVKRPVGGAALQRYRVDQAFHNEALVYRRLRPLCGPWDTLLPRCLHADPSLILLQDLRAQGFRMPDRRLGLALDTATAVLKALARFHAASYHASVTNPEEFVDATNQLKPLGIVLSSNRGAVEASVRRAARQLSEQEDLREVTTVLHSLQGRVQRTLVSLRRPADLAVLIHGDFWINNLLVRPEDATLRIVDLQACAVLSPAVDVWTLLYTSLQQHSLDRVDHLLQLYCQSFIDGLNSSNTPNAPSLSQLFEEIKSKELYGFLTAVWYFPALDLSEECCPDLDNVSEEQLLDDDFVKRFESPGLKRRLCNLARHCLERGVFHNSTFLDA